MKVTKEEANKDLDASLDRFKKQGGFIFVGITEGDGLACHLSIRGASKSQIIYSVASSLDLSITEVILSMEQYKDSQKLPASPLRIKKKQ